MVNQIAFNLVFNKIVPTHQIEKIVSNLNWIIHLYIEYFFYNFMFCYPCNS